VNGVDETNDDIEKKRKIRSGDRFIFSSRTFALAK
jgi:hypothetical protein